MRIISTEKIPIKMWLDDIEDGALGQAKNLANLPFAFRHVAIMPDSHLGYGMPIGGVLSTKGVVIPNAVGVDIGCGMCAVKTSLKEISLENLKKVMGDIRKKIPVGFEHHEDPIYSYFMPKKDETGIFMLNNYPIVYNNWDSALKQLGTLGGGNHFIEIQKGSDGYIWVMIHSGSRNLGKQVAEHYNNLAVDLNQKWHSNVPKEWKLAFLPIDSEEGRNYMREMEYCVKFALANRKAMMETVIDIFVSNGLFQNDFGGLQETREFLINIAHNYAKFENHFGENVVVHRKGATLASRNNIGIIPGSQGSKSYIVEGLGNADSFNSCSHGAGRKISRSKAEETLDLADEIKKLDDQGILHAIRGKKDLDEAPGAYKDIDQVMENQKDLVKILVELTPLGVIKG